MEVANTSFNLGDAGSSNVDTSSSISNGINGSQQTSYQTSINTGSYQSNGTYTGAETETYDLSGSTTEDNRNVIQRVGDWISDAANSVYETGANIVSDAYSWIVGGLKGIGSTLEETAANLASDVGTFAAKVGSAFLDGYTALMSTEAVIATSVVSGVAKLGEHFVDVALWCGGKISEGRAYVAGTIVGLFDKDLGDAIKNAGHQANQQMKEWIEFDAVGEANKWFYENTGLGRWINDNSLMKYDSEAAMKIRGITEKAAEFAAATALTIATGGAATFAIGALYGIGKQAESTYQQHGTDTTLLQEAGILGSGALTGLSWLVKGKLGAGFLEIGKTAAEVGIKEVISQISKDVLTKDFWMKALKEGLTGANGVGNYAASAMMTGEDIIPYLNGEKPWDAKAIGHIALCYLKNLGYNVAEDALRGYISGFSSEKAIESITESASKIDGEMSEVELEGITAGVTKVDTDTASKVTDELSETDLERVTAGTPKSYEIDTDIQIEKVTKEPIIEEVSSHPLIETNSRVREIAKEYSDNIEELTKNGVSVEDYFKARGIEISDPSMRFEVISLTGDPSPVLLDTISAHIKNDCGLKERDFNQIMKIMYEYNSTGDSSKNIERLDNAVRGYLRSINLDSDNVEEIMKTVRFLGINNSLIDVNELYEASKYLLSDDLADTVGKIMSDFDGSYAARLASNITETERTMMRLYTYKDGADYYKALMKGESPDPSIIQQVYKNIYGTMEGYNPIFETTEPLVEFIDKNRIDKTTVISRLALDLNGVSKKKEFQVGQTYKISSLLSATGSAEDAANIAAEWSKSKIKLEIIAPAGSRVAYIEGLSDVSNYFQNEFLIGPNQILTIISEAIIDKVGKKPMTIIRCLLSEE